MIDKKYDSLNLLPIEIDTFVLTLENTLEGGGSSSGTITVTYTTSVSGTYAQGSFPGSRWVKVTVSCEPSGSFCPDPGAGSNYIFQGISTSSSTFIPPNSNYNFNSTILDDNTTGFPYEATYTLNSTQTSYINQLSPGTYYVWFDGGNRGTLTITSTVITTSVNVKKDFVITNKPNVNPIIGTLTWNNPTGTNYYYYSALSTSPGPVTGTVYGFYGPYNMPSGGGGSIDLSTQFRNVTYRNDGDTLYLLSYRTTSPSWNILASGFNSTSTSAIFQTNTVKVRNLRFNFFNPTMTQISVKWGSSIQMPLYGGYASINWQNFRLGTANYVSGLLYNTLTQYNIGYLVNTMNNNTYWIDMYGNNNIRNTYNIRYSSGLPDSSGINWINTNNTYQVSSSSSQSFNIPSPTAHGLAASEYGEYTFNKYTVSLSGGGGTTPTVTNNVLNIPSNTYGNINVAAVWDYQKYNINGIMRAINSGSHTDINGATKNFTGYEYVFYTDDNWGLALSQINYRSNSSNSPIQLIFDATSKAGYEFVSESIINYPFDADGSISNIPYNNFYYGMGTSYNSNLPAPLWGNSGMVTLSYQIDPRMSGNISIGMEMRPFNHPIFVSLNSNISSFTYNGQVYNSTWANNYVYNNKTYYKLNGATFNVTGASFIYNLTDLVTTAGFYAPNKQISIVGTSITTNDQILNNAFVDLEDATPITYHINTSAGTGVFNASISPNTYNVLTNTFTPSISSINKWFGYNTNIIVSGNIYNGSNLVQDGLTSIVQITKPSYNNYNYLISTSKELFYINKNTTTPYGISSYTLSKNNYEISSSKQEVTVSYTMNNGYQMNTSNLVNVGLFYNVNGNSFYGADQTYNKFNIPANTIGNVIFKAPEPSKIQYFITNGSLTGIKGINTITYTPNNYYISNSATKQSVSVGITVNDGYDVPTGNLTVTGSSTSEITNSSFKINTNGYGNITVVPASPVLKTYNITINPINIPTFNTSGINTVTLNKTTYNVESTAFTPGINSITYINNGFNGYVIDPSFASIPLGSFGDKSYNIYANAVTFNIAVTFDTSISSFNYGASLYNTTPASIDTYNVLQSDKSIALTDIVVKNQLYLPKANFTIGSVNPGSTGDKSFALSSSLKVNNININTPLPTGYASSTPNVNNYTATNSASRTVLLTHVMNAGYAQPTGNLVVSNVKNATGANVSVTNINNRAFTIPRNSWGDITVALADPVVINYTVNFQNGNANNVPIGVNSTGFGISPTNYRVTDTYPRVFTVNAVNLPGYETPTWTVTGGSNKTATNFDMSTFNTTVPVVTVTGGNIITYNMNVVKGAGINTYNYGNNIYNVSTTLNTYNVLSTRTITLTNIKVINALWNPVANYDAISVTPGNTGDKSNTVSTTLKTSNINKGTLPTGIGAMTFNLNTYQSVINTQVRTVSVSYTMNDGYSLPSAMNVTGSLDGANSSVTITPPNANQFNIAPNTWNTLTVTPSAPTKINYNISDGTKPYGIGAMSYSINTIGVNKYNISTSARTVDVTYTMNNGYAQPTGNLSVSGGSATVTNNRAFSIPINGFGDITVTPNTPSKIQYFINVGTKPNGINTVTVTPNNYYIDNTNVLPVSITYTVNTGWSLPTANPTVIGSNVNIINYNSFNILTNGYGNITVTSASPIANIYNLIIGSNPKPAAINQWSVSPNSYKVTDTYPKTFNITATNKAGYAMPTWSINGTMNSATSFQMASFTETVPNLQITAGTPIEYYLGINYNATNSGITAGTVSYNNGTASINNFNIETPNFTPVISGITYASGYNGYNVIPAIAQINVGTIGNKTYTVLGTPIVYNLNSTLGVGINTAVLNKSTYNIQQTPFNVAWGSITYNAGYNGYTLSGDSLSVPTGAFGDRSYTITGNEIIYDVTILNPAETGITSFNYGVTTYSGVSNVIDTYTITSENKTITLTDVVYSEGFEGPTTITIDTITSGSIGNKEYSLIDVHNVYIDVHSYPNPVTDNQKIASFDYNSTTYNVNGKEKVLIDYVVASKSNFGVTISNITYENGYSGPTSYNFGTVNASVTTEDVVYSTNLTSLNTYTVTVNKPDHIVSFDYDGTTYNASSQIDTFTVLSSDLPIQITNIVYETGYTGVSSKNFGFITTGTYTNQTFELDRPSLITYTITINKPTNIVSYVYGGNTYTDSSSQIDTFTVVSSNKAITITSIVYASGYTGVATKDFGTITTGTHTSKTYSLDVPTLITYTVTVLKPVVSGITSFDYNGTTYTNATSQIDTYNITSNELSIILTNIIYEEGYEGSDTVNFGTIPTGSTGNKQYELSVVNNVYINVYNYPEPVTANQKIASFDYDGTTYNVNGQEQVWIDYFVDTTPSFSVNITNIVYEAGYSGPTSYNFGTINPSVITEDVVYSTNLTALVTYTVTVNKPDHIVSFDYDGTTYNASSQIDTFTLVSGDLNISITNIVYENGYTGASSRNFGTIPSGSTSNVSYNLAAPTLITYNITVNKPANITSFDYNSTTYSASNNVIDTFTVVSLDLPISITNIVYDAGYTGSTAADFGTIATGTYAHQTFNLNAPTEIVYDINILKPVIEGVTSFVYGGNTYTGTDSLIDTYTVTSANKVITLTNVIYEEGYVGSPTIAFGNIPTGSTGNKSYTFADVNNVFIDVDSWTSVDETAKHYKIVSFKYKGITNNVGQRDLVWIDYFVQTTPVLNISLTDIVYQAGYAGENNHDFGTINPAIVTNDVIHKLDQTNLITYKVYIKKDHTVQSFRYRNGFTLDGNLVTVNNNDLVEVNFTVQSKLDVTVYNIVYTTGYEGYNNGPTSNPTTISYDSTNYDRTSNIGSTTVPTLVTYDKLTNYTITINKHDPSSKLTSFNSRIQYNGGNTQVLNDIYTILSDPIDVTAIDFVYQTGTNSDGTWTLFTGPEIFGYDDGSNTSWSIPTGSTGDKIFTIPVNDITSPAVFNITYSGTSKTANGYTSEIDPVKESYVYQTGTTITKNNTGSFIVVDNAVLPAISDRLAANDPIHYSYTLSSNSAGMTVNDNLITISNSDFGDKVVDINWTEVVFSVTVKDHYIIRDVYGFKADVTKTSPISGLTTDADVFIFEYSLHNTDQDYLITNNIYNKTDLRRTGWTFVNARETVADGTIEITGTDSYNTGFTVPAGWYDDRTMRLVYTPNTYTITLTGADPITVIYDHEIQKWGPANVPVAEDKIFNGFEDGSDVERITYSGTYNFSSDSYSTNVTFFPRWIDRDDFMSYDATSNVVVDSNQMEEVTISETSYSRFKESVINPTLVQNLIPDTAIESNQDSTATKYMFKLLSGYIKLRKLTNYSVVKGYSTLTFIDSDLNTYLNNPVNLSGDMVIDMGALITQLENSWSGANSTDLLNIGISKPSDLWSYTSNKLATADIFRIMLKVSNSSGGTFTHWIFDGMVETANLGNSKQNLSTKQDMFLLNTPDGLKEIMKIRDKNNVVIYDRTPYVLDNNVILTNWEDSIIGQTKPVDVYGLLPVNKDKVYSMNMNIRTSWKSESLVWTGLTASKLPYSSNVRTGELAGTTDILNYTRIPIGSIYSSKIDNTSSLTLNILKNYSIVNDKLVIDGLDSILGPGATEKGALSSDGAFYIPTFQYELSIDNANSSSLRTAALTPTSKRYVYTPTNRNIGSYVIQGPASDVDNNLRFLLNDLTDVVGVYIGLLDSNLNSIVSMIPLEQEGVTNWFRLVAPAGSLSLNDYYTIVVETADKLMYNNLLIYKRFNND